MEEISGFELTPEQEAQKSEAAKNLSLFQEYEDHLTENPQWYCGHSREPCIGRVCAAWRSVELFSSAVPTYGGYLGQIREPLRVFEVRTPGCKFFSRYVERHDIFAFGDRKPQNP